MSVEDINVYTSEQIDELFNNLDTRLSINSGSSVSANGIINLVKGDTLEFPILLNVGNPIEPIIINMGDNDRVELRVFNANDSWTSPLITKTKTKSDLIGNSLLLFEFESEDSENLNCGTYFYQVKYFGTNTTLTIIPRSRLIITN